MKGICTLANDYVYDQVIALLNSIEVIMGPSTPVCIYPYDNRTEKIAAEIAKRPQVQLYNNQESIKAWDNFAASAWDTHPTAKERWLKAGTTGYHRFGTHRRYCAFDSPFENFIYMDADTLLMNDLKPIFEKLDQNDCVVYDFQHKDITHVYDNSSPKLTKIFSEERLKKEIFCSGFYASKKGLFDLKKREWLIEELKNGDAEILYPMAPDQTLINYIMMKSGFSIYNLALNLTPDQKTGCCVTSPHFTEKDHILYDNNKRLTYLHYIGISSQLFTKICQGENLDFPYRDLFLYYRYLYEPEKRPQFQGKPKIYNAPPSFPTKILNKLGLIKRR